MKNLNCAICTGKPMGLSPEGWTRIEQWHEQGHPEIQSKVTTSMTHPKKEWKELREEFQDFADSIVWQNDDGSEKYIGVGNMADWWIKKIESLLLNQREEIVKKLEGKKKK